MDAYSPDAYDLIGDLHGQAQRLRTLLEQLGYRETDGAYRHPQRQALFVGDFIDRGPQQRETVAIVRAMVEAGSAQAVLGNHEFNAIAFATEDPEAPGTHLRPRSEKNRRQHQDFLNEVEHQPEVHADIIDWFRSLPLYLELPGLRLIHACWEEQQLAAIRPFLDDANRLTEAGFIAASRCGHPAYAALESLIKGLEMALPDGHRYQDKTGHWRTDVRVRWWDETATDLRDIALLDAEQRDQLPSVPVPPAARPGYSDTRPLFIGHYWLDGEPAPLTPKVACLDYSGVEPGILCAYRWQGETQLRTEHFCWVGSE
ncbi:metallophosphoesterase [Lamprobacter modestohalophilus]|uniref:Metallophosphoesterase n=1 Tax=Lamprobacter modestohalophilus TaxID=1064514 RepID=A0A9X0WES3_9GAMM|nr:metallophosphoesterase [Lamprobacter modestohalophilus]MBK1621860.1 metallophosphoesterase [Lamprobacter modestohalophilus]